RRIGGDTRRGRPSAHDTGDLLKVEKQAANNRLDELVLNSEDSDTPSRRMPFRGGKIGARSIR
ncbi:hypothetical protein ACCS56_37620, partial [Rhizobium ruizarguesonis]